MKKLTPLLKKQAGQALPMALILLFVGAMLIVPALSLTTTNLKATQGVTKKTLDVYAADAGIDDGLWKVRYNYLPTWLTGAWTENTYIHASENYTMYDSDNPADNVTINERSVEVAIRPIWALEGLEASVGPQFRSFDPNGRLLTFGTIAGESADETRGIYKISIYYNDTPAAPDIERIGCWLPPGMHYYPGSSNLEQNMGDPYYCEPVPSFHNGGEKIIWNLPGGVNYEDLPADGNKRMVTFEFTPNEDPRDAFSWTKSNRTDYPLSWDTAKRIFEVISTAPGGGSEQQTTITSHSIRKEFQAMGGALSGDYQATGNTLMRDTGGGFEIGHMRDRLYNQTSANITTVPSDATVEQIRLYWSGWKCKPWDVRAYTPAQMAALPLSAGPTGKYLDKVRLKVNFGGKEFNSIVTATAPPQALVNLDTNGTSPYGWTYACFADVTNQVTDYFKSQGVNDFRGNAQYNVGHWDVGTSSDFRYQLCNWKIPHNNECTSPPTVYKTHYPLGSPRDGDEKATGYEDEGSQSHWAHAAWSVIVIYSSPSTASHYLYVVDEFRHYNSNDNKSFIIKGFLAPEEAETDPNAARMTCFVGEGDYDWTGDNLYLNESRNPSPLNNAEPNPTGNVWNSKSNVLTGTLDDGIDIDTFNAGNGIILDGDTEATVRMITGLDTWNLIYIILSFRSEITTGGVIDYSIE